ncbi:MAG: tetratricopeptide repeat protein [Kiritimatiellae bacterium]|nr:tetratricopeptide repeat protein [Kiritimatiellia bacterium]
MLLLEFRPITRGRLYRSRVTFLMLALAALALYAGTVCTTSFPGNSAAWIAWAAGLDVREAPTHPLSSALGHWVAGFPWFSLPVRMNLLAAVAGALAVGWVYRLVWFFVFEMMREESAVTHAPRNARFGGMVAALAVGTSLPFWQAATRFGPEIFDVAGLLFCAVLLTVYARSQNLSWLLLFGALYGAGMAESHLFLVAAPAMAALAVIVEWKLAWCRIGRLFAAAWIAMILFSGVHYWAAHSFLLVSGGELSRPALLHVWVAVFREQLTALAGLFPKQLWLPVFVLGVGAAGLSFFAAFRTLDNRRNWSLLILSGILTVFAALVLFNVPFSPWGVMAPKGVIPAATYTLVGSGIGLLAASWRALAVVNDPLEADVGAGEGEDGDSGDEAEEGEPLLQGDAPAPVVFAAGRGLGLLLAPVLVGLVVISGFLNGRFLCADTGAFADRAADAVLDGLRGRTWVVSNGLLDPNLLIRAHERGVALRLICPYRAREKNYAANLLRLVLADTAFTENAKLRAKSLIAFNVHLFIDDLFANDTGIDSKAVCMGLPDLWFGSNWTPVPERLFFGGVREIGTLNGRELQASHEAFWLQWKPFLDAGDGKPRQLSYRHRTALRRHVSFVANNLGVTLDDLGLPEEAFRVYLTARELWPDNISALLNLFELVARGRHPEMRDTLDSQLRHKVENPNERFPLWALSRYYGYVRNYGLFVRMGWSWALSSSPGSVLAGLRSAYSVQEDEEKRAALSALMASVYALRGDYRKSADEYRNVLKSDPKNTAAISGLARLALQQSVVADARKILEAGEAAGASKRLLRQDWAALHLVAGDLPRARILLQELAEEPDVQPMTLAMLAMVMIEQQEAQAVEAKILPRLGKMTGGKDAYFAQVVQGRIWQGKGKAGHKNARLCFHRASLLRPDVQALQEVILMLDVSLEDQKAAEAHALTVLRQRPNHPYANFIIGSIRLEQGQYGDAESYLRRSAEAPEPTLAALNNYAQTLCRIRKLDAAEAMARKAASQAPDRYEGWGTLAFVLAVKGETGPAAKALATARAINSEDERLCLVEGLIAVSRGDSVAAVKAADTVGAKSGLSVTDRRELQNLRDAIARLGK